MATYTIPVTASPRACRSNEIAIRGPAADPRCGAAPAWSARTAARPTSESAAQKRAARRIMLRSYRMRSAPRLRAFPFVLAIAVSAALVLSAPFIGYVRSWIRTRFPGQFVRIVGGAIAVIGVALVAAALLRVRSHRALRYGALALSIGCAAGYSLLTTTG